MANALRITNKRLSRIVEETPTTTFDRDIRQHSDSGPGANIDNLLEDLELNHFNQRHTLQDQDSLPRSETSGGHDHSGRRGLAMISDSSTAEKKLNFDTKLFQVEEEVLSNGEERKTLKSRVKTDRHAKSSQNIRE